jgi:regulator of sigma D
MINYNFYNQLVQNIEKILPISPKKALRNYYFLKKYIFYDLLNFLDFIKTLKEENKLFVEIKEILISELIPFISDDNILFQDTKIIEKNKEPYIETAKIKKIIYRLDLNKEKELNFWEGVINLITELENYLEFYNIEEIKTKSLKEIREDLRKIAKGEKIYTGSSELYHINH